MTAKKISYYLNSDFPGRFFDHKAHHKDGGIVGDNCHLSINFMLKPINQSSACFGLRDEVIVMLKKIVNENLLTADVMFFVQGSYATGDITAFSDIDMGVIISDDEISVGLMKNLRRVVRLLLAYIYSLDPLMHHGVDVICLNDRYGYDESVLPVETLKKSVVLNSDGLINVIVDHELSAKNAKTKLLSQCDAVISYKETRINCSLYKMKCLISVVLLIPVLLLQADAREFLYKRDAIKRAREFYKDKLSFIAIDMATELREGWSVPFHVSMIRGAVASIDPIFPCLQNAQRVAGSTAFVPKKDVRAFLKEAKEFAHSVRGYICG